MVSLKNALVALATSLCVTSTLGAPALVDRETAHKIDKPTVDPPVDDMSEYLIRQLKGFPSTVSPWSNSSDLKDYVNLDCMAFFGMEHFKVKEIDMFNATYEDCSTPWVMCRHPDADFSADTLAKYVSRIPVGMRTYIKHVIAFPKERDGPSEAYTFATTGNLIIKGAATIHQIIAAAATIFAESNLGYKVDSHGDYWESPNWLNAVSKDTAVINKKAQCDQKNNLAQMTVLALYGAQKPNLLDGRVSDKEFAKVANQYYTIQQDIKEGSFNVTVDTKCGPRSKMDSMVIDVSNWQA